MIINPAFGDATTGGIIGFCAGYASKKVVKLVVVVIGAFLVGLQLMANSDIIHINYDKLYAILESLMSTFAIPDIGVIGIGVASGFVLGWQKG